MICVVHYVAMPCFTKALVNPPMLKALNSLDSVSGTVLQSKIVVYPRNAKSSCLNSFPLKRHFAQCQAASQLLRIVHIPFPLIHEIYSQRCSLSIFLSYYYHQILTVQTSKCRLSDCLPLTSAFA